MSRGSVVVAASLAALWSAAGAVPACASGARDEARWAEEELLGSAGEDAAFRSLLPFSRQFDAEGAVAGSFAQSTAAAGVPVAATFEALRALAAVIDLAREVRDGDRFYVRWQQTFTIDDQPVGIGRILAVELVTSAPGTNKGTIAISRFRPLYWPPGEPERFWLASGPAIGKEAAAPPIRLPLDKVTVTSGFGLRADPLDQPQRTPPVVAAPPPPPAPEAAPPPPPPRKVEDIREIYRAYAGYGSGGQLGSARDASARSDWDREIDRVMAERRVRAREAEARKAAEKEAAERAAQARAAEQEAARLRPPPAPAKPTLLYMHEGLDLLGDVGTPVRAAADGLVILARADRGYGNAIHIEHADRRQTIYGHLQRFAPGIEAGTLVKRGDLIGFVGSSGRSTGAHLHFELLVAGKPVNPLPATKDVQLDAFDLARFKKQLAAAKAERERTQRLSEAPPSLAETALARHD